MGKHVFLEVTSSCAKVVTLCATEISFSCMGYHVFFEGTSLCAGLVGEISSDLYRASLCDIKETKVRPFEQEKNR